MGLGRASKAVKPARIGRLRVVAAARKNGVSMALRFRTLLTVGITAVFASGCSLNLFGRGEARYSPPPPLTAAPTGTVTGATLLPPEDDAAAQAPSGLAALDPSASVETSISASAGEGEIGRTDLLGGWTINAAGDSCQLFMTLTTWAGGYRASTRGCVNAAFQGISAWNIEGGQIQLLNDAGTTVARLYAASKTQLNGQTPGGGPIAVTR
jgi:hypothetical protein